MSMEQIRRSRRVPAKRGKRIRYTHEDRLGTIKSARGGYLRILLDGDRHPKTFHPTWMIDYLDDNGDAIRHQPTKDTSR